MPVYSDPDEALLLSFFSKKPESQLYQEKLELLRTHPSWSVSIHLSPVRHHLLDWFFSYGATGSLLEVGAGTGSLTGLFLDNLDAVTVVEQSPVRAEILQKRFADRENLEVKSQDFAGFSGDQKFEYLSLVGVLEYAGVFFNGGSKKYNDDIFVAFLEHCKHQLTSTGTLFLAIENQWGLKYLSGCVEDHYQQLLVSLSGYPNYTGVRTFGKEHLGDLLRQAGFRGELQWYFPFPDYKFPQQVLSEEFLDSGEFPLSWLYPSPGGILPRVELIQELAAAHSLKRNKLLSHFANSFLVIANVSN